MIILSEVRQRKTNMALIYVTSKKDTNEMSIFTELKQTYRLQKQINVYQRGNTG